MVFLRRIFLAAILLAMAGTSYAAPKSSRLEPRVEQLEAQVAEISQNISVIEGQILQLGGRVTENAQNINANAAQIQNLLFELEDVVSQIEELLNSGGGPSPLILTDSGPVSASADGEVIENLRITADCTIAIEVKGFVDVIIRNVEIRHSCDPGIRAAGAHRLAIQDVRVIRTDVPESGPAPSSLGNNIVVTGSDNITITRVQLWRGSAGIYTIDSYGPRLSFIEGHDFRGPMPRGQLVQFNKSPDCLLENFSAENPRSTSWTEDNVSVFQSPNCVIRKGLLDGNNSPSGVGVMFELTQSGGSGLVEDVDTIRQGNGSFASVGGQGVIFRRTRARDNSCEDEGRGLPGSGGVSWHSRVGATGTRIEDSSYWNLCFVLVWRPETVVFQELIEEDFTLNAPLRLTFPWD